MITLSTRSVWLVLASTLLVSASPRDSVGGEHRLSIANSPQVGGNGETTLLLNVTNDMPIICMDIPLRFGKIGDPIRLLRVDFADRVANWEFKHASIDNTNKTVIIGLIAVMNNPPKSPGLQPAFGAGESVAELVFAVPAADDIFIDTLITRYPDHELSFIYNSFPDGKPRVNIISPAFELSLTISKTVGSPSPTLSQSHPNPFNAGTSFTLSLPSPSHCEVRIINITGQTLWRSSSYLEAGMHELQWDGRSSEGNQVASGVYFYQLITGEFRATRRITLLR